MLDFTWILALLTVGRSVARYEDKALVYLSLGISITALCYAVWVHQQAAQVAEETLQKREQRLVQKLAPKVREVYQGLGITNVVANPTTMDELFGPYLDTFNQMLTPSAGGGKKMP